MSQVMDESTDEVKEVIRAETEYEIERVKTRKDQITHELEVLSKLS